MDARRRRARASSALRDVEDQPARDEERERDRDHDGDATEVLQHERTLERGRPFERGRRRADRARGPRPRPVPQPRRRRARRSALDDLRAWYRRGDALNNVHRELEELTQRSIQKVAVVRFNPFADTGGDQSFAIALLDAEGNGVVLSSLHSRADTRIFAKQVLAGRSRHQLSDEEQDAIRKALAPAGA